MAKRKGEPRLRKASALPNRSWEVPRYSRNHAECMLCLLDAWRDMEDSIHRKEVSTYSEFDRWMDCFRSNHGSFDLRHMLEQVAPKVEALWKSLSEDERDGYTFDWEFCPDAIAHAIDYSTLDGNCVVKLFDDAADRIRAHRALRERFAGKAA